MKRTLFKGGKEPETMRLQAVGARLNERLRAFWIMIRRVTVCSLVKSFRDEAIGKPSLNRATVLRAVDAKPSDLPMSRLKRGLYCVEDRTHLG